jgi:hypothetical protein
MDIITEIGEGFKDVVVVLGEGSELLENGFLRCDGAPTA